MEQEDIIRNKVAESGLMNFDCSELRPDGKRIGIDMKDFLYQELILKEQDFREKVQNIDLEKYRDAYVHIESSVDAIIPLWAYFLLTSKLFPVAKKVHYGSSQEMETLLYEERIRGYDFTKFRDQRVLVKGCSDTEIPIQAFVHLVQKLQPIVKSLFFGEACSSVPIFKKKISKRLIFRNIRQFL